MKKINNILCILILVIFMICISGCKKEKNEIIGESHLTTTEQGHTNLERAEDEENPEKKEDEIPSSDYDFEW